jgi:spermidine synthase
MKVLTSYAEKFLFLLKIVFFFSGFSSLIYQVVWQRLLTTYYGVGSISITLIVSVYMLGLGIGALLGGFLAERVKAKITLYFLVELLLGVFGLASLPFLDVLGSYTAGSSYIVSFCFMFLFLCIPTVLMGITLPLLTKIYNRLARNFLVSISILYFINTLGAALGAVIASYVVISFFGLDTGIYVAASINFVLAILIFTARAYPQAPAENNSAEETPQPHAEGLGKSAYLLVFITGFLAIGYEIVWFRVIGVLVKESAYAFSSILSVYLAGIALGSYGIEKYIRNKRAATGKNIFFLIQFLIGAYGIAVFAGYYYATRYTPLSLLTQLSFSQIFHPSFDILLSPHGAGSLFSAKHFLINIFSLADVFFWPILFVLVPTILMGASFPLLSSLAISRHNREGSTVGRVYFFNVIGNVLGGVVTGFILLPILNTETTLLAFGITGLLFAFFISGGRNAPLPKAYRAAGICALILAGLLFFPAKGQLYKTMHNALDSCISFNEGVEGVVLTQRNSDQNSLYQTMLYINGSLHGSLPGYHYYAAAGELFGYIPRATNVLVIGYGIGIYVDAVLMLDDAKKVTLVELSGTLMNNLKEIPFCNKMLADKRLEVIIDDGRRYLLRTPEKFDLIIMDPLRTTWAYSNNLYSVEFFNLVQNHLKEGGVLFVGIDGKEVLAKTLISVFAHVRHYKDIGFLASSRPFTKIDSRTHNYFSAFDPPMRDIILHIYKNVTFIGEKPFLTKTTAGYPINWDKKPVSEYYLGLQIKEKFFNR